MLTGEDPVTSGVWWRCWSQGRRWWQAGPRLPQVWVSVGGTVAGINSSASTGRCRASSQWTADWERGWLVVSAVVHIRHVPILVLPVLEEIVHSLATSLSPASL